MSLLSLRLGLVHALGYGTRHSLDCALRALGQIIDGVCRYRHLLGSCVSGNRPHEAEHAHHAPDEEQRHPDETAPKQTWWATTTEGGEETRHANDEKDEANRCNDRARHAQKRPRSSVFWGLKLAHKIKGGVVGLLTILRPWFV
jgi:hypothetical protein